ncbi:MAG: hypothetical protein JOZ43_02335 [Acidobacteriales bacterium]|nr:hypothetical protein [Terriglobales bacterium]
MPAQQAETGLASQPARSSPEWLKSGVIYQIFPRSFSAEGNLEGVTKRLGELHTLGVNILWLMPIHPNGQKKKKGTLGSAYAVRDYYAIDPALGKKEDLKRLVEEAHRQQMKVIIDMVANHTAWDSVMMAHPDFYKKDKQGQYHVSIRLERCRGTRLLQPQAAPLYDGHARVLGQRIRSGWVPL